MKPVFLNFIKRFLPASLALFIAVAACERSVDGLTEPGFTENPDVFIDGFSSGLEYYPYEGSKLNAFSVDKQTTYGNSATSMRFDVPNVGDPSGPYSGAIFRDDNGGRNLSTYNALTFYVKATTAATINDIGFGQDFEGNAYQTNISALRVATNWQKVVIPIPDPLKLKASKGMFWYAEGPEEGNGYTFWIDELKYENLAGMAQPRASIMNGDSVTLKSFIGSGTTVSGLTFTINQSNGQDVSVTASPAYFEFLSSDPSIATVDNSGQVTVVGTGTTEITATLGGVTAKGSIALESIGEFLLAPTPTDSAQNVISIFSDAYDNVPVDFYNGYYAPYQTTTSNDFEVAGNKVLGYENFNFVGMEFNKNVSTIDGSEMTHLRMDIFFPEAVPAGSALRIKLVDFGPNGVFGGDDIEQAYTVRTTSFPPLASGNWIKVDMPISSMTRRSKLGQIVLDADLGIALRGASFYVDNVYLRK